MDAVTAIQKHLDVEKLLEHYNFNISNSDGEFYRSACKIHGGNNPTAFVINLETGLWYCHTGSCGGGDVFTLVEHMEGCDFYGAITFLSKFFQVDIQGLDIKKNIGKRKDYLKELQEFIRIMATQKKVPLERYELNADTRPVRRYRDFDERTLKHFNFRYMERGTFQRRDKTTYQLNQRFVIPLYVNGIMVGVTLRKTRDHQSPKWLHQPVGIRTNELLYNLDDARESQHVVITEGIFDVWAFHEIGIVSVATFGAHITKEQRQSLLRLGATLTFAFDGDNTGRDATLKALTKNNLCRIADTRVIQFGEGEDPANIPREKLRELYQNSIRGSQFIIQEKQRLR